MALLGRRSASEKNATKTVRHAHVEQTNGDKTRSPANSKLRYFHRRRRRRRCSLRRWHHIILDPTSSHYQFYNGIKRLNSCVCAERWDNESACNRVRTKQWHNCHILQMYYFAGCQSCTNPCSQCALHKQTKLGFSIISNERARGRAGERERERALSDYGPETNDNSNKNSIAEMANICGFRLAHSEKIMIENSSCVCCLCATSVEAYVLHLRHRHHHQHCRRRRRRRMRKQSKHARWDSANSGREREWNKYKLNITANGRQNESPKFLMRLRMCVRCAVHVCCRYRTVLVGWLIAAELTKIELHFFIVFCLCNSIFSP